MAAMVVGEKFDDHKDIKAKKINKTFSLSPDDVAFLDSVDRKSAFLGTLLEGYRQGQFIGAGTSELLSKYKTLFGADPEDVIRKILARRIERIENNMNALKEAAPAEVKNRVGGAFLKLNRAYEELVAQNETLENKQAITFGLMFKQTGCNHQSIRGWIRANKERLDEYHRSLGITDPAIHNRQIGVIKRVKWQREKADQLKQEVTQEKAGV